MRRQDLSTSQGIHLSQWWNVLKMFQKFCLKESHFSLQVRIATLIKNKKQLLLSHRKLNLLLSEEEVDCHHVVHNFFPQGVSSE